MFNENTTDANRKTIDDLMFFDRTSIVEPDTNGTPEQALLSGIINSGFHYCKGFLTCTLDSPVCFVDVVVDFHSCFPVLVFCLTRNELWHD